VTKPICILTLPRSGSEVLQFHLADGLGYPSMGEFLCFNNGHLKQTVNINSQNIPVFKEIPNLAAMNRVQQIALAKEEFLNRINLISMLDNPVVVKAFACEDQFTFHFDVYEKLFDVFQVIVLVRQDARKSLLSRFICEHIGVWHPITNDQLTDVADKLDGLKFSIPEPQFVRLVRACNELQNIFINAKKFSADSQVVLFEDFKNSPRTEINRLFNVNSQNEAPHNTFIMNHEQHIKNLERVKELYAKFANTSVGILK
jgi:hypothetical protein